MATYAYVCDACGKNFEISRPMSDREKLNSKPPRCVHCKSKKVRKQVSMFTAIKDWRTT